MVALSSTNHIRIGKIFKVEINLLFNKKDLFDIIICCFLMWLGCQGFPNEIDNMMSSTWLSICVMC